MGLRCHTTTAGGNTCVAFLRSRLPRASSCAVITTDVPSAISWDSPRGYQCPHGVTYWVQADTAG